MSAAFVNWYYILYTASPKTGECTVIAVAPALVPESVSLILRFFRVLTRCEHDRNFSLKYVSTSDNLLNDPHMCHLGLRGGNANVFSYNIKFAKRLFSCPANKLLVFTENESLFPHCLRDIEVDYYGAIASC